MYIMYVYIYIYMYIYICVCITENMRLWDSKKSIFATSFSLWPFPRQFFHIQVFVAL